ncbi:hypothetical protein OS493_000345 [Desmophyllum pertusum]|uniref:Myb/SANT-like DNA-binding domain-containing protein n=1 Tax=Desmophyllum pertusum TaxID=174260 RepID=A0A9X0DC52_9CNID|nr:hypothetical protein OS493_000345 [Desmophyllum pertusum]
MASRGKTWSNEATDTLINLWSEETIQFALNNSKTKESGEVYNTLQVQLQTKGFEGFTVKEVISKMKKLKQKYKTEKDKSRKSGNGSSRKQWKYFSKMDNILSERHIVNPPSIMDSMVMSDTSQEHLKHDTAVGYLPVATPSHLQIQVQEVIAECNKFIF